MIEENILDWIELSDSIQRIDSYNNKINKFFKANYLLLQYADYSQYFYFLLIFLYFGQIWEMNILNVNTEGDGLLEVIKYLEKIFLFRELITNNAIFMILLIICLFSYIFSLILSLINVKLYTNNNSSS